MFKVTLQAGRLARASPPITLRRFSLAHKGPPSSPPPRPSSPPSSTHPNVAEWTSLEWTSINDTDYTTQIMLENYCKDTGTVLTARYDSMGYLRYPDDLYIKLQSHRYSDTGRE
jgi:hypothetical protein